MKKRLFLRDDDAAAASPAFRRLFRLMAERGLPVTYAVIPALATPALVRLLKGRGAGRLFETAQHGLRHADHGGNRFMRQEFGPARTFAEQAADAREGARLMRRLFGPLFAPVFVPPFHNYNSDTARAAAAAGLKGFSASKPSPALKTAGLRFLRTHVNVNSYGLDLEPKPLDLKKLKAATLAALRSPAGTVGVYFHHDHLRGRNFGIFSAYAGFIGELAAKGLCEPVLFSALLARVRNT